MNGYNAQKYLREAIESVYAQTFDDWEIIFIDNCSTDDTKKIVKSYDDKIKYYKTEKNIPLGAARNFGLQYCKGEYLAFLDTDDVWLKDKLSLQVKLMDTDDKCQLCYGGVIYIDEDSKEIGEMIPQTDEDVFLQQLKRYEINMQSVMLRNSSDIRFNEKLRHSPDFDLFMDIVSRSKTCIIRKHIVKYRKLQDSLTSKNIDIWWSELKYTLDRIFSKDTELKNRYIKGYNFAYAKVAYNKAQYLISVGKRGEAIKELSKYRFLNFQYFILYLASLFPAFVWHFIHRYK